MFVSPSSQSPLFKRLVERQAEDVHNRKTAGAMELPPPFATGICFRPWLGLRTILRLLDVVVGLFRGGLYFRLGRGVRRKRFDGLAQTHLARTSAGWACRF